MVNNEGKKVSKHINVGYYHAKLIDEKALNLSQYVRNKLDEEYKKELEKLKDDD